MHERGNAAQGLAKGTTTCHSGDRGVSHRTAAGRASRMPSSDAPRHASGRMPSSTSPGATRGSTSAFAVSSATSMPTRNPTRSQTGRRPIGRRPARNTSSAFARPRSSSAASGSSATKTAGGSRSSPIATSGTSCRCFAPAASSARPRTPSRCRRTLTFHLPSDRRPVRWRDRVASGS